MKQLCPKSKVLDIHIYFINLIIKENSEIIVEIFDNPSRGLTAKTEWF